MISTKRLHLHKLKKRVSIPERDYRWFQHQKNKAITLIYTPLVSIPERDYRWFQHWQKARNNSRDCVSIPERDYRWFQPCPCLEFQSLKGIIGDFNSDLAALTAGLKIVSIPERDYRWFQPRPALPRLWPLRVSIPERDYRWFQPNYLFWSTIDHLVSIPERDYRWFQP